MAALDLYPLGQEQSKRRGECVRQGAANFERAIQPDPKFARALWPGPPESTVQRAREAGEPRR